MHIDLLHALLSHSAASHYPANSAQGRAWHAAHAELEFAGGPSPTHPTQTAAIRPPVRFCSLTLPCPLAPGPCLARYARRAGVRRRPSPTHPPKPTAIRWLGLPPFHAPALPSPVLLDGLGSRLRVTRSALKSAGCPGAYLPTLVDTTTCSRGRPARPRPSSCTPTLLSQREIAAFQGNTESGTV